MSKDDCKQRFKGVENFLRRVAFNLGNTPSQTEVKVISCIPIDVTDLQQKIIELEKQLEGVTGNVQSQRKTSVVHTAICTPLCPKYSNAGLSCKSIGCHQSSISLHNQHHSTKQKKSAISIICPSGPSRAQDCFVSTEVSEMTYIKKPNQTEVRKKFFNKRKVPKNKKLKTQFVYYAQTDEKTPFNNYSLADVETSKNRGNEESNIFGRSYLTDAFLKTYRPGAVNVDMNMSEFSTPICRDVIRTHKVPEPYESDMCSCCHGQFQNIDNHMSRPNHFDIFSSHTDSNNAYYDSNLYDVVPVKENAVKIKNIQIPKIKVPKNQMDIACCPGNIRPRYKFSPIVVNYNTTAPTRYHTRKAPMKSHNRKEKVLNKMSKKNTLCGSLNRQIYSKVAKTRSVEIGEVYTKRLVRNGRRISKLTPTKNTNRNDAACFTTGLNKTECKTASGIKANSQQNTVEIANVMPFEDKTKVTLSQIKEILQSVLTEVKTTSKIGNRPAQTVKKDAVVQNGLSQSNIYGRSSLLQTFTYSPYDMDPYGPSCSQQMQTGNLCYPNVPPSSLKCMQHYPLIIQPGRNTCASCYRDSPQLNKLASMKRAASTATNTEELRVRSKETENLIKEIYKAMALNIEIPTEDTTVKENSDIKHTIQNYNTMTEDREAKHIAKAISEIFKNTNPMDTSASQNTGTPFESKLTSYETSFRSQPARSYAHSVRNQNSEYYSKDVNSETVDNDETEQVSRELESDDESDVTIVNEETESSVSETESDDDDDDNDDEVVLAVEEPNKKKGKKGLFRKMLNIFRPRTRNMKKYKGSKKDPPSDSDSVNYQTARSYKGAVPKPMPKPTITKSHAILFYSKQPRNQCPKSLPRRSPYMEQEYRRYFDEKLTFHDNPPRSSTRETPRKRPVFYQKVETRSALVDHYTPPNELQSIKQYTSRGNQNKEHCFCDKSSSPKKDSIVPAKAITWLEKHKLGIHCGKQWKKLILEG